MLDIIPIRVTLQFGIILCLMLTESSNAEFNADHKTKLQIQAEVNFNNPALIQTYPTRLAEVLNKIHLIFPIKHNDITYDE